MTTPELKPCPFCGSQLSGLEHGVFGHEVGSPDCILSYTAFDASDVGRWNTRSASDVGDEVERVERAIADALKPYNDWIGRGQHAHEWIARRCAAEARAALSQDERIAEMREALVEFLRVYDKDALLQCDPELEAVAEKASATLRKGGGA